MTAHGNNVLDDIHTMLTKYVAFPDAHAPVACALWVAHTWVVMAFFTTPRLVIESPEPGSGKTRLLEVLAILCRTAKMTMSTSPAALYRRIGAAENPPTILADEVDTVFGKNASPQSEDLRAIFNSGYRKGATVDRCEGDGAKMKVAEFKVFAPAALAGLGAMPRTITTRGIPIHMRKRAPGETVAAYRERDAIDEAQPIIAELTTWAEAKMTDLEIARPDMPAGVVDRPAEVWEPLLSVAESIGGKWPALARAACKHYVLSPSDEANSLGVRLLADIRGLFHPLDAQGVPTEPLTDMHSADIVSALTTELDSPWRDLWGKPLDQRKLASELRKYGVRPKQIRIGEKSSKGYQTDPHNAPDGDSVGLDDAWRRYLPPDSRNNRNKGNIPAQAVSDQKVVSDASETTDLTETESETLTSTVSAVSDVSAISGRGAVSPASMPLHRSLHAVHSTDQKPHPVLCPSCGRAPARADSGVCDFCTSKRERLKIS